MAQKYVKEKSEEKKIFKPNFFLFEHQVTTKTNEKKSQNIQWILKEITKRVLNLFGGNQ